MKMHLVIIDPQNDFVVADDGKGNKGTLVVPGAQADMSRVADLIRQLPDAIDAIYVTLDSHHAVDISHPVWWRRSTDYKWPDPFTVLGVHPNGRTIVKFVAENGTLIPTDEEYVTLPEGGIRSLNYLKALAAKKRYPHVIWPEHCLIGSWGSNVVPELHAALCDWERKTAGSVQYIAKGMNPWTEHFSGVRAEVPDYDDPSTLVNGALMQSLWEADLVVVAGEALSHCVGSTVRDIINEAPIPERMATKMFLLTDCTSNVPGFEAQGKAFLDWFEHAGGAAVPSATVIYDHVALAKSY